MPTVDKVVSLLERSKRGRALDPGERRRVAEALVAVTDARGRVRGLPALEVLASRPEHFEGSGRFSAIFRAVLDPDRLTREQLEEVLLDLEVQAHFLAAPDRSIADYKRVRSAKQRELEALTPRDVRGRVLERLKRIGFWSGRRRRYEGVVLIGIDELAAPRRGRPRRELRQEFLYGFEHPNLLCIALGSVVEGRLVQFEEYWGYRDWRSLGLRERARVALDAARGVAHLHRLNVIHRDIKPENVLVKGRKRPQAKLCDYGLIDSEDLSAHGVTRTEDGTVVGTILYMAPEQARGQPHKASDVFALGGLLYTYLTDQPPTPIPPDATRHEQSDQVLHRRIKPHDPVRAAPAAGRGSGRGEAVLVERLSLVVAACLQERPEERYAGVDELVSDLEAVLAGEEPEHARERARALRIPIDLYRGAVFSPVPPFPTGEVVAELVGPRPGPSWGRRLLLAVALALAALAAVTAADVGGARGRVRAALDAVRAALR